MLIMKYDNILIECAYVSITAKYRLRMVIMIHKKLSNSDFNVPQNNELT